MSIHRDFSTVVSSYMQAQLTHIIYVRRISTPGQQHLTKRVISIFSCHHQWCLLELSIGWRKNIDSTYSHTILHNSSSTLGIAGTVHVHGLQFLH